jgi:predicted NACHT family NTPase
MKRLCLALFHEENFPHENLSFPVLVRCRDLNLTHVSLFEYIFAELGLQLVLPDSLQRSDEATREVVRKLREQIVSTFLESLNVLLIVDGFDEIADEDRQNCLADIRKLAYQLRRARLVVTSRTGEFNYHIDNTAAFEIRGLDDNQIREFARKWLQDDNKAADFVKKINATPFIDAAIRPLTLAHLCAIYERNQDVPEKPKTVYKKIVNLLLEEWDQERSIKRVSKYAQFEADRKFEFLSQLAYFMTTQVKSTVFSTRDLQNVYDQIHDEYGLDSNDRQRVVGEIESHTGLFLKSGYERYEFAHKSLQEYLTAEFIVKLPSIPHSQELNSLPNELAVAVAISSRPGTYFAELVFRRLGRLSNDFLRPFLYRLLIERPDFNSDSLVQLALLKKLSEYLDDSFVMKGRPWDFHADELLNGWENVIKRHHSQTLAGILNCYETEQIYDTRQPDLIHKLSFHPRSVPDELKNLLPEFPKVLFVRTSILNFRSR